MEDSIGSPNGPLQYRMTLPVLLAFVACMLSIYLLGQHVYRYGSGTYANPGPVFSETEEVDASAAPVAVVVSSPQGD